MRVRRLNKRTRARAAMGLVLVGVMTAALACNDRDIDPSASASGGVGVSTGIGASSGAASQGGVGATAGAAGSPDDGGKGAGARADGGSGGQGGTASTGGGGRGGSGGSGASLPFPLNPFGVAVTPLCGDAHDEQSCETMVEPTEYGQICQWGSVVVVPSAGTCDFTQRFPACFQTVMGLDYGDCTFAAACPPYPNHHRFFYRPIDGGRYLLWERDRGCSPYPPLWYAWHECSAGDASDPAFCSCICTSGGTSTGSATSTDTGTDTLPASCLGHCGTVAPQGCWCDSLCSFVGDCCGDVCDPGVCDSVFPNLCGPMP